MEKILLHSCCAPCSGAILEWMMANGYEPTVYYYNPNIFPERVSDSEKRNHRVREKTWRADY